MRVKSKFTLFGTVSGYITLMAFLVFFGHMYVACLYVGGSYVSHIYTVCVCVPEVSYVSVRLYCGVSLVSCAFVTHVCMIINWHHNDIIPSDPSH